MNPNGQGTHDGAEELLAPIQPEGNQISRRSFVRTAAFAGAVLGALTTSGFAQETKHDNSTPDPRNSDAAKSPTFDPEKFFVVPPKTFEDLKVGDIFRAPSRTLTDAHSAAFQTVSCDNHPIHYDVEFARRYGHSAPVVHALQVLAFTTPGATLFPQYVGGSFIAFTEASCQFLKEVHSGDTLYPMLEITDLIPQGDKGLVVTAATVHNQRGEMVLSGQHKYLLRAKQA